SETPVECTAGHARGCRPAFGFHLGLDLGGQRRQLRPQEPHLLLVYSGERAGATAALEPEALLHFITAVPGHGVAEAAEARQVTAQGAFGNSGAARELPR